jgi:TIR domain
MASQPPKVFISYNRIDRAWAEWIAGTIERAGYEPIIQAWHFRSGENFVQRIQEAVVQTDFIIPVFSENYLKSEYTRRNGLPRLPKTRPERNAGSSRYA